MGVEEVGWWCYYRRMRLVYVLIFAGLISLAQSAQAEPRGDAVVYFEAAEDAYKRREYEAALDNYRAAYRLSMEPLLLYNIAQCYRFLGQDEEALRTYKAFLFDAPPDSASQQEAASAFIVELTERIRGTVVIEAASQPPLEPETNNKLWHFAVPAGLGLTSVVSGIVALQIRGQIKDSQETSDQLQRSRAAFAITADVTFLAAGGSALWLYLKQRTEDQ
jgi:tetratricopeptide (TPR) repeat protein